MSSSTWRWQTDPEENTSIVDLVVVITAAVLTWLTEVGCECENGLAHACTAHEDHLLLCLMAYVLVHKRNGSVGEDIITLRCVGQHYSV